MKSAINWKLFFILLGSCLVTTLMVLPYALSLIPAEIAMVITPAILIAQVISSQVLFSIAIFFGLFLAKRVGFGLPILEGMLKGEKQGKNLRSILCLSIGLGMLTAVLIILFSLLFKSSAGFLKAEMAVPIWKSLLASFYGGVAEEVLLRLFFMTILVWITFKIKKTPEGKPTVFGIWLAIILSSVLFGLGHLPITGALTAITPAVVTRAVVLNGIGGIIFGWLYAKKGLESAMISHFSADISLHVILPLILSLFI